MGTEPALTLACELKVIKIVRVEVYIGHRLKKKHYYLAGPAIWRSLHVINSSRQSIL